MPVDEKIGAFAVDDEIKSLLIKYYCIYFHDNEWNRMKIVKIQCMVYIVMPVHAREMNEKVAKMFLFFV